MRDGFKKFISVVLTGALVLSTVNVSIVHAAKKSEKIFVTVDGAKISKEKSAARKIGKSYLVNAKLLAKKMAAKSKKKGNTITLTKKVDKKIVVKFTVGKKKYLLGKKKAKASIAPRKISGEIFVCAKAVAKAFKYDLFEYNKKKETLKIGKKAEEESPDKVEPETTPSEEPGEDKTAEPTKEPGEEATNNPTLEPTKEPEVEPTNEPEITNKPSTEPSTEPTSEPEPDSTPKAQILPKDKYPVILHKDLDYSGFFSEVNGDTTNVSGGAEGSAGGLKMAPGTEGTYYVTPRLISGETYFVSVYVKGDIEGIYAGDDKSKPTLDLSNTKYDDWTLVKAEFVAGRDVGDQLSVKIKAGASGGCIDEFKIVRYVPAGEGSDENYENPLMRIRIDAPNYYRIDDYNMKDEKLDATIVVDDGTAEHNVVVPASNIVLEGRGNSTFYGVPKKPLKFKFSDGKQAIGNLPEGKKWNLMADYYDRTMMRNGLMQNFAGHLPGLGYATRTEFVELYVNEVYMGVYLLTEAITVSKNRVDIDDDPSKENFGFLVEWDQRAEGEAEDKFNEVEDKTNVSSPEDMYFKVQMGDEYRSFAFKSPDAEDMTAEQRDYVRRTVQQASDAIRNSTNSNEYLDYIDLDSFIDFFIVNDYSKNSDVISFSSIFLNKDKDGKLKMGPCWDYDIYVGNGSNEPNGRCMEWGSPWYSQLVYSTPFKDGLANRWNSIKDTIVRDELINYVDELEVKLASAAERNFKIWDTQTNPVFVGEYQRELAGSWSGEVRYLKNWLSTRWNYVNIYYVDVYRYE